MVRGARFVAKIGTEPIGWIHQKWFSEKTQPTGSTEKKAIWFQTNLFQDEETQNSMMDMMDDVMFIKNSKD